jgi:hypothetical protein
LSLLPRNLPAQQSHLVVISGISGGPEYAERFNEWAGKIITGAERLGVAPANIIWLSEEPAASAPYAVGASKKEEVSRVLGELAAKAAPDDIVLLVLIGHGSAQGSEARFNLPGPDLTATDYARLLDKFPSQRVAVVNAASASGDFIGPLSKKNRIIITATRSGGEKNETVFGEYFAAAYASDVADADKDGTVSLLEAFEYARREVQRFYETEHRIQTEHAMLDDNGDGQGSREPNPLTGDGALARRFVFLDRSAARVASGDSTLAPLYADVRRLEGEIATLRAHKDSLKADAYDAKLEELLVQLAEKNQAIKERSH